MPGPLHTIGVMLLCSAIVSIGLWVAIDAIAPVFWEISDVTKNATTYEVRRGAHVLARKNTQSDALAFADVYAHFPGQLSVYGVQHLEWEVSPDFSVVMLGAGGPRAGRGRK